MEGVFEWVATYGYTALFLLLFLGVGGLPIPDETLMVFTGYLISRGQMHPAGAYFTALAGSWCGISVSYLMGRTLGLGLVHRYGRYVHLNDARLAKVHAWFDRIGHWALFVGYYIIGVRHFTAVVAGTSKLEFRSFALYAWSGAAVWVATFLAIGYELGENWEEIAGLIHRYLAYASVVLLAVIAAVYLIRRTWRGRRSS